MKKSLLSQFGSSKERLINAINSLKSGNGIIVLDNEKRENEGDLIFSGEKMTIEQMALTIRHGSGIICVCITEFKRKQLKLPIMVKKNTSKFGTNFTITVEAAHGISTGVSAQDRITTIRAIINDNAKPSDLNRPGHIFPLQANKKGIKARKGHTEAAIELMKLSGLKPIGVICELTNDDGTMSKLPEIIKFAKSKNMNIVTIQDIIENIKKLI
ncbi:MAG: 3,4-dihydroxy-2-butanone-4-phosphate synthase [Buchnera aphidicola (Chaetogeoica yunlongensis)]